MSNECDNFCNNSCCTIKGDKGEKGEIGFTGMQGNKGEQGIKGQKGEPADVEQDININSMRVKTVRVTEKIKVKKISGLNELGVTASNTLDINSNIIPGASIIDPNNRGSYKNYDLGSEQKPWSKLYSINVDTDNIEATNIISSDISILNLKPKENDDIFIDGNLITNNNFNIGENNKRWSNIYTKNLDSTRVNATNIEVTNLNSNIVNTSDINTVNVNSTNISTTDISSVSINVQNLNVLFDISGSNIKSNTVNVTDTNTINLKVNEIESNNLQNLITFNGNIISDNSQNTIGTQNNVWHNSFFNNVTLNNVKTTDLSKNLLFETNLLPNGVKDVSNIVQLDIGDKENIWNKAFINDISVNKINALNDPSKNILVDGNLIPNGPYENNTRKYSIGTRGKEWKDLHISTGTIYIGGAALGINEVIENNKKRIELLFYPNTENDLSEIVSEREDKAIVLTSAEFNIVSEQDNDSGEIKQILDPIEETFSNGKLLDLEDIDISKNELKNGDIIMYDESKEKFVIGEAAVANNSNQTLLEVLSEQPQKFNYVNSNVTSGSITIEWNYDDIIVKYDDDTNRLLSKGDNLKDKMIPYIDKIHVDISGTIHGLNNNVNNNIWIPYNIGDYDNNGDRVISNNDSYNTALYKVLNINKTQSSSLNSNSSFVERILSEPAFPISFRIYGINDSKDNDSLKNNRALYFNNLSFLSASPPKKPFFVSENITNSKINLIYKTSEVEEGNTNSSAKIVNAELKYREIERKNSQTTLFRSTPFLVNNSEQTENVPFQLSNNIVSNSQIPLEIDNFRPGTKYRYSTTLTNNLVSTKSESSEIFQSNEFTNPPSSNSTSKELYFFIRDSDKTNITSNALNSSRRLYVNIGDQNLSKVVLNPKVSNISNDNNPQNNANIEISSDFKLGKDLDGISDLVNINVYFDSLHKQEVRFNGYNASSAAQDYNNLKNSLIVNLNSVNTYNFISNTTTQDDMYNITSIPNYQDKMGFRLKANIVLSPIKVNDIRQNLTNTGGENSFIFKYEYIRKGKLYQNNTEVITSNSFDLFIDNLNVNPSFPNNSRKLPNIKVENVIYCMGIPTVHKFTVTFDTTQQNSSRTYKNINSSFGFMRGDLKIADIQIIGDTTSLHTSKTSIKQIKLKNNGVIKKVPNQEYNLSETNFSSDITSYFKNFQYTQNNYSTTNNIKIKEKIYSLRTEDNGIAISPDVLINTQHYCDYNSFNSFTNSNPSVKINENIVEINTITDLNSNIGNIQISNYSHEDLVKNHTLLFINGIFQTNQKQPYPIISNYLYQSVTIQNTGYTSSMATSAYDVNGNSNSSEKKYKWIGFKLTSSNITLDSATSISFVNINSILRKYFTGSTFDKLKNISDTDVIGFIKVQNSVGNLSRNYNTLSPWDGISSATSLANIFDNSNKGANYNKSSNEWGPVVNPTNTTNGIFIFIGLNNTVAL